MISAFQLCVATQGTRLEEKSPCDDPLCTLVAAAMAVGSTVAGIAPAGAAGVQIAPPAAVEASADGRRRQGPRLRPPLAPAVTGTTTIHTAAIPIRCSISASPSLSRLSTIERTRAIASAGGTAASTAPATTRQQPRPAPAQGARSPGVIAAGAEVLAALQPARRRARSLKDELQPNWRMSRRRRPAKRSVRQLASVLLHPPRGARRSRADRAAHRRSKADYPGAEAEND